MVPKIKNKKPVFISYILNEIWGVIIIPVMQAT